MNNRRRLAFELLAAAVAIVIITILGFRVASQNEFVASLETIPPQAPTLWSMVEGPYAYMADETLSIFNSVYMPGTYEGIGQVQYKGFAIICMMGIPQAPRDTSMKEAWCVTWRYNVETELWVADDIPYFWGTMGEYVEWREEMGLDPVQ